MKTQISTLAILLLISGNLFGQFAIDPGNDTILCVSAWGLDTTILGGSPTATGGTEPYTYAWETRYAIGLKTYGSSYFLDDTTKANPKIVANAPENLTFILRVSDNTGSQLTDSISIRFSQFAYTLADNFANIAQGDSVTLWHNIGLGIQPLTYTWTPNYNISDTTISNPRAWPEIDTDYQVFATDSIGCVSEPDIFKIKVNTVGILENKNEDFKSIVFPNPLQRSSSIYIPKNQLKVYTIKVINTNGQLVLSDTMDSETYNIGSKINKTGLYVFIIFKDKEIVSTGQFVKR